MSKIVAAFAAALIGIAVAFLMWHLIGNAAGRCRAGAVRVGGCYAAGFALVAEMVAAEDCRRNAWGRGR